jgi:Family of unknown function (DUF6356)
MEPPDMIRRIFLEHPATVGETYWEHFGVAASFGAAMIIGGIKAMTHAVFPNLCKTSGSDTVRRLHAKLVEKRAATAQMHTVEWMI